MLCHVASWLAKPPIDSYEYLHLHCDMNDEAIVNHFEKQTRDAELDHYQKKRKRVFKKGARMRCPDVAGWL